MMKNSLGVALFEKQQFFAVCTFLLNRYRKDKIKRPWIIQNNFKPKLDWNLQFHVSLIWILAVLNVGHVSNTSVWINGDHIAAGALLDEVQNKISANSGMLMCMDWYYGLIWLFKN